MEQIKNTRQEKEITLTLKKSEWKKIKKLVSRVDDIVEDLNDADFGIKIYDNLYNDFNDLRRALNNIGDNEQEAKTKLGEIYEKGFRSGIEFVNYTWLFDYAKQEECLVRSGEMKKNYGELWDRNIEKEIKKEVRNIK